MYFHVLKHCVVLWLNTQKIFWKECRLVLLLELTWGKRPQPIFLHLYSWSLIHKNQDIAKPIWNSLIQYCSFSPVLDHDMTLCHEKCFYVFSQLLKYQLWLNVSPLPGTMNHGPTLVNRNTLTHKIHQLLLLWCILFCLTVKWLSKMNNEKKKKNFSFLSKFFPQGHFGQQKNECRSHCCSHFF